MRNLQASIRFVGRGLLLAALLQLTGCVSTYCNPGIRTRAYLYDAYHAWENGKNDESLTAIKRALSFSRKENVPETTLVEVYDDAGLYYHLAGQHHESVIYQAVAVLLARKFELSQQMTQTYENRLGRALTSADPVLASDAHVRDTDNLLAMPGVRENPHIRRYYGLK